MNEFGIGKTNRNAARSGTRFVLTENAQPVAPRCLGNERIAWIDPLVRGRVTAARRAFHLEPAAARALHLHLAPGKFSVAQNADPPIPERVPVTERVAVSQQLALLGPGDHR